MTYKKFIKIIPPLYQGQRLDVVLAKLFSNYSRSKLKIFILKNLVLLNKKIINIPKKKVLGKELIEIKIPIEQENIVYAQNINLDIIYEDNDIIVINKSKNIIMHPGTGNSKDTILNALLYYYPPIINVPRAGIIHRLDKNTTGLFVVAKNITAQRNLINALKKRNIIREYQAIVIGIIHADGIIKQAISRNKIKRTKMMINPKGKPAITYYYIIKNFCSYTWLRLKLETGRTHQIRIHLAHINHPIVGDNLYIKNSLKKKCLNYNKICKDFNRQALHACTLKLSHPINFTNMEWHVKLPYDMIGLLNKMKKI